MTGKLLFISVLLLTGTCLGQACSDTLEVSKKYKTILIFPENISESIIGNDFGFIADLPKAQGGKFNGRILKLYYDELATETENFTNHTVITESGNVYDFILKLTERPKKLTWYIRPQKAITNIDGNPRSEKPVDTTAVMDILKDDNNITGDASKSSPKIAGENSMERATKELYRTDPLEYYRLRCYYMQFDKAKIGRYFARTDNLFLWLKGVYFNEDELYFQYRIENGEGLDLDINFIRHRIATNYKNSSSNQKLELEPVFV
ncbi:MAG TPA: DUF4138 domain-containing protein, partial [Pricia sp.]|nr:DUF4138 domain-containing protein [Pricia sp.]